MKPAAHTVLARKYRPQLFEEVLGQPAVSETLKKAVAAKRLAHAYLFTGPRGVGKTTMARLLAKALNCKNGPTPEPCGACDPCLEIAGSSALDVLEMDAASHTGVDNVRQVIIETVALAPSRDRYKVFIIDEAHMLSTAAFNALLKTLEEPPAHVVFILATTESAKIPATIASRCQRFRFRPMPADLLSGHLAALAKKEGIEAEPEALELLARSAEGSVRDAVSLLDQCHSVGGRKVSASQVRELFGFVSEDMLAGVGAALAGRDAKTLASWLQKAYAEGIEPAQLARDLRASLEEVYLERLGVGRPAPSRAWAAPLTAEAASYLLKRLNKVLEDLRFSDSPRLTLELGLFGCLEAASDLAAWVERLESLERRLSAGGAVHAPAPPPQARAAYAPEPEPEAPPIAAPSAPAPAAGSSDAWAAVVASLRKEKAALAATLEGARCVPGGDGPWKLVFKRSFELEQVKRHLPAVTAALAAVAGPSARLELEVGEVPAGPAGAGPAWEDVTSGEEGKSAAPMSQAQEILGGKLKIVKKRP